MLGISNTCESAVQSANTSLPKVIVFTLVKSTFFNCKTDSKVVAWGEILGNESVGEWTEFTLPLTYVKEGVRPTHITIVTTASSYGDYFTGSTDSWMCVDDFELIY
jgi:hypothetical protein